MASQVEHERERELRQACAELDRRLRAGESCRAEGILSRWPELAGEPDHALELIYTEFATREELGERPDAAELYERFPQWRQRIERLLNVHEALGVEQTEGADVPIGDTPIGPRSTFVRDKHDGRPEPERHAQIGQYELLDELGHGGMGVVYRARQRGLGRIVAVKLVRYGVHATPDERTRFRAEAEAAARLQHPNVVHIYEVGEHEGCPFLSMEFVDGGTLEERLTDATLPAPAAAQLIATLAETVHYAHQHGIVHRDLKPANVLLRESRESTVEGREPEPDRLCDSRLALDSGLSTLAPVITDFGLAKRLDRGSQVTGTGQILGTPSYMSPEQATGRVREIGPATDIYALGAILYRMLTGRPPFQGDSVLETIEQIRHQEPVPPRRLRPKLPRDLETICLKCLEKEPGRRYATAERLAEDLRRFLAGEAIEARPIPFWERALKWARRRPAVASLLATVVSMSMLAYAVVTWAWLRAETNRIAAEHSRVAAVAASERAETARAAEQAERERVEALLYSHDIALAYHEYLAHHLVRANQLLAACRPDRRHWEWDYLNRLCNRQLLTLAGHTLPVRSLAYSPDGNRIASSSGRWGGTQQGEVKVWDATTGQELFTFREQRSSIEALAFSPDGKVLASASVMWDRDQRGDLRLWDLQTGRERLSIEGDSNVFSVAFSPDGRLLALGYSNGKVSLYDSSTGKEERVFTGHSSTVHGVDFSHDGARLVSGSYDNTVRVWDSRDGREIWMFRDLSDIRNVSFSPDGTYVVAAAYGGTITLLDAKTGSEVAKHRRDGWAPDFDFSPADQSLAVAMIDQGVYLLHALTGKKKRSLPGHGYGRTRVVFSPDGRRLVSAGDDRLVRVWDLTVEPEAEGVKRTGDGSIAEMAYSPDGKQLAVVTTAWRGSGKQNAMTDKTLRIWDAAAGRQLHIGKGHTEWLTCLAYSPDGRIIATGSDDRKVRLWRAESGELLFTLTGHVDKVTSVAFHPDGGRLVSASLDKTLRIWDSGTGQELASIAAHGASVTGIATASDGQHVVVAGEDGKVKVWNITDQREVAMLRGHSAAITYTSLHRDSGLLATADAEGVIHIWDLASALRDADRAAPRHSLRRHIEPVTGLSFSRDGKRLASVSSESVTIWDTATGQEILSPRCRTLTNSRVAFSPEGRQLAVSAKDSVTILDSTDERHAGQADAEADRQRVISWHQREAQQAETALDWFAAAFHLSRLIEAEPDRRSLVLRRAYANAARVQWHAAAADYNRAAELKPLDPELAFVHAAVLSLTGDSTGYQAICQREADRLSQPINDRAAYLVARLGGLAPNSDVNPAHLLELAQQSIAASPNTPWYWHTLGLAQYRAGQFESAVASFRQSINVQPEWPAGTNAFNWLGLAMAYRQIGKPDEAQEWLDKADRWAKESRGAAPRDAFIPGWHQHDWLAWQLLRRETED